MQRTKVGSCRLVILSWLGWTALPVRGHRVPHDAPPNAAQATRAGNAKPGPVPGISGQGKMKFRVLQTSDHLPEQARKVLASAHGGFAVDRRTGKEETYFALSGAGILQISADLRTVSLIETPDVMKKVNLHNTTFWQTPEGTPYLVFPANDAGKVFTTTLNGKLVHTLNTPTAADDFDQPQVNDYFFGKGNFAPTDVEEMDGLYYVTTGYSNLDFVLTARVLHTNPFEAVWNDLAFAGKGDGLGQFGTAHGITVPEGQSASTSPTGRIPASTVSPATATTDPPWRCPRGLYLAYRLPRRLRRSCQPRRTRSQQRCPPSIFLKTTN